MEFGPRLRHYREAVGLTQEDLAQRADEDPKYLSRIENGHVTPAIDLAIRLVERGLGMPAATFFANGADDSTGDDVAAMIALMTGRPAAVRRRALRVLRALLEE